MITMFLGFFILYAIIVPPGVLLAIWTLITEGIPKEFFLYLWDWIVNLF